MQGIKTGSLCLALMFCAGCSAGYLYQGRYLLSTNQYGQGRAEFEDIVNKDPNNAIANYYLGRFFLAEGRAREGLLSLLHAAELDPSRADTYFWIGVAYSELNQPVKERDYYQKTLSLNDRHTQARTYLAHSQLESGQLQTALSNYEKVLLAEPKNSDALYNRAVIYSRQGLVTEEEKALKQYLFFYPYGGSAKAAIYRLNQLGDFEYRNYVIGLRSISLKQTRFLNGTSDIAPASKSSLNVLGAILAHNPQQSINIVVYHNDNNKSLAEARAKSIKKYILAHFSSVEARRLKLSWFTAPEKFRAKGNIVNRIDEAVNFFGASE